MTSTGTGFDVSRVRRDFPILAQQVHGKPLVYLDNAATSQKPQSVLDTLARYYTTENSNVHRGIHYLSEQATADYEDARSKVRGLLNASDDREIIFVRGTTEGINLVAGSYGRANVGQGDEVIISAMEHHSNIVPWQILCQEKGANLRVIPMNRAGELLMTGEFIDAAAAHRIGLYNSVVPDGEALAAATEFAEKLARGPSLALQVTKDALNREALMELEDALEAEARAQAMCMLNPNFREAYEAFVEKRRPRFV